LTNGQNGVMLKHMAAEHLAGNQLVAFQQLATLLIPNESLNAIHAEIRNGLAKVQAMLAQKAEPEREGWLDSRRAAKYMGVSRTTFDKYRYQTEPKLKGCPLDGKIFYKKSEIDSFIMLYALKSKGLA